MKKTLKTALVSTMVLAVTLSASVASAVTYPVLTKTAANFTVKNADVTSIVPGFEKLAVKTSATATTYTLTNLVPLVTTVQKLGGTVTISGTNATIKYDGKTIVLGLTNTKVTPKVGTVYYIEAGSLAAKLLTSVEGTNVPVAANLTANTLSRSVKTASYTIKNVDKVTTLLGLENSYVAPVAINDLVPLVKTVEAVGGTASVTGTEATINYDGSTSTLTLTAQNSRKIGTVDYVEAGALAAKLVITVNGTEVKVVTDLANNTFTRSKSNELKYQWSTSGHAHSNTSTFKSPINNYGCVRCHDGAVINIYDKALGFTNINQVPNYVAIQDPAYPTDPTKTTRDLTKVPAIGCSTCHPAWYGSVANYGADTAAGQAYLDTLFGITNTEKPLKASEIAASGNTPTLMSGYSVQEVGTSALCVTCHEGRKLPDKVKFQAPHAANESDIVFGYAGFRDFDNDGSPDFSLPAAPHAANENVCVGCHMPRVNGIPTHTMDASANPQASCALCHTGIKSINRLAYGDYDGDKAVETVANEIAGLKTAVKAKLLEKAKEVLTTTATVDVDIDGAGPDGGVAISGLSADFATTYTDGVYTITTANYPVDVTGGGSVTFVAPAVDSAAKTNAEKDAQVITTYVMKGQVSPLYYGAAFNYVTATSDGSNGIHNPGFLTKLLQETYKALNGGKSLPGAYLR